MKRTFKDWLTVLGLLVDEVAAAGVLLFLFRVFDVAFPLWLIIVLGLVLGSIAFVFHRKVIPTFRHQRLAGPESMIGLEGKVVEPLRPSGTIRVKGEYWKAECLDGEASTGEVVEICRLDGLLLKVKRRQ